MAKRLIDEKLLNSLLKAIEIHVSLIENGNVYVSDPATKDKLQKSIQYLKDVPNMINSTDSQIKELKRKAYTRYLEAKKKYDAAVQSEDSTLISECFKNKNLALDYYVQLKALHETMTNNISNEAIND